MPAAAEHPIDVAEEDLLRARTWGLLARLLRAPADAGMIDALRRLTGDATELGAAFRDLARAAAEADAGDVAEEYAALFIGLTHGEVIPYASYYLTGFLQERPLAALRGDMGRLGIAREETVREPEDHIAALAEMMAGLITGAFGAPATLAEQQRFFETHIAGWAPRFFADLEEAPSARFHAPVGRIGRLFMTIERQGFALAA